MQYEFDGGFRNRVFLSIVAVIFLLVLTTAIIGQKQNQTYMKNYMLYQQALTLIGQQKYQDALANLQQLGPGFRETYPVFCCQAYIYKATGKYPQAAHAFEQFLKTYPAAWQEGEVLHQYGDTLYCLGRYEEARIYLEEGLKYSSDPNAITEISRDIELAKQKLGTGEAR